MPPRFLLALDQGTSSSRAALVGAGGQLVAVVNEPFPCLYPADGWVEQDPEVIWGSQIGAARRLLAEHHVPVSDLSDRRLASMRTLISGGTIVTAEGSYDADLLVDGETIAHIGRDLAGAGVTADQTISAGGAWVIPGAIDVHTHMELPFGGTFAKDTFETGTRAAAFGGT